MPNPKKALAWARAHKRATLSVTVLVLGVVARYVPGLPKTDIVNAVALLLGA